MSNREVSFTQEHLEKVLMGVSDNVVLVGGQALMLWAYIYNIDLVSIGAGRALTKDADFLGHRKDVKEIAKNVSGYASYPPEQAMTILAGQTPKVLLVANQPVSSELISFKPFQSKL